jgi:hypothetical protein
METITTDNQLHEHGFYWRELDGVRALVCSPLEQDGFVNGFSTRLGGVSDMPANALSLAGFNDDRAENILENRRRFLKLFPGEWTLAGCWQVHGADVRVVHTIDDAKLTARVPATLHAFVGAATLTMRLVAADATLAGDGRPPLTAIPLDGARWYRTNPSDLPEDVTLVAPRHMAVANDVVTRSPDRHPEPLGDLMCWRRASMERSRDRCRQLAPAIPPRRSVRQGDGPRRVLYVSNQSGSSGAKNG